MRTLPVARLAGLLAVASVAAGCSAVGGGGASPSPRLQLRIVISSAPGRCTAPSLTSDGPGSACDKAGTTTYELGESLGVLTPTSVTRDGQEKQSLRAEFDKADASKFGEVTRKALEKQLAILFDGKVLTAPVVKEPLTGGNMSLTFGNTAEAEKVAAELGASATP